MNKKPSFFSLEAMRQPVNQWIGITFIIVLCAWTVLYYVTQKAQTVTDTYANVGAYLE